MSNAVSSQYLIINKEVASLDSDMAELKQSTDNDPETKPPPLSQGASPTSKVGDIFNELSENVANLEISENVSSKSLERYVLDSQRLEMSKGDSTRDATLDSEMQKLELLEQCIAPSESPTPTSLCANPTSGFDVIIEKLSEKLASQRIQILPGKKSQSLP